jgi:hypothetical protein
MTAILFCHNFWFHLLRLVGVYRPAKPDQRGTRNARKVVRGSGKRTVFFEMP